MSGSRPIVIGIGYQQAKQTEPMHPIVRGLGDLLAEMKRANKRGVLYGVRMDPFEKVEKLHDGIDLPCWVGTELFCPWPGKVEKVWDDPRGGKSLIVHHQEQKLKSGYCHLHDVEDWMLPGREVSRGALMARTGISGRAKGAHLHFTIRVPLITGGDWFKCDPLPFLQRAEEQEVIL